MLRTPVGFLALLVANALHAQASLTLEQCIQLAQGAPSSVAIARQQTVIARYGLSAARAGLYPAITLQNGYTYTSPYGDSFRFVSLNAPREYVNQGAADAVIDTSGRVRAEIARAKADQRLAQSNVAISQRDIRRLVTSAYYRLVLARRIVRVAQDALAESQRFQELTQKLFTGGEAAQADVIKASSDTLFQQQSVSNAELEAQLANHDLASFWTPDVATMLNVVDPLDQMTPVAVTAETDRPFLQRPEFAALTATRDGFLADARRAKADLLPQMRISYLYGIDSYRLNYKDRGQAIIASLVIPVFDWHRTRNLVAQAQVQADQVETNRAIAERTFSREYQDALARVNQFSGQLKLTDEQVRLSTENLRLSRVRYQGGEGLALDVVSAQNQLAQARANQFTAKANYANAKADLEVAAGR
ncbi:MAG: TolC family protein [Bryobacteraceae bacterium]